MATRKPVRLSIWEYAIQEKERAKELLAQCKEREKKKNSGLAST